ncbi:MAG TPA: dihydrodipicolinate synthase family protein [Burkholderiales bacterium]|nr:dihydrodipicolinate synthase family protein [Burkholderiales bacterium]
MPNLQIGLVHTPVTPFKRDHSIDYDTYGKLIEFHLRNGADALALPTPDGEDMSLKDAEQPALLEFALRQVKGRVPVIAHVSDAGTSIAVARARAAEAAGAAAIVSHPPYFWHPKPSMITEHLVQIGSAVRIPFFIYTPPVESAGATINTEIAVDLVDRLENYAGVVDASMEWVFMMETVSLARARRSDFQLVSGADYMVSCGVIGGTGAFSAVSAVAPKLVRQVYDLCRKEQYIDARPAQEQIAALRHLLKSPRFETGLKAALRVMGRDCGQPRPPLKALDEAQYRAIAEQLNKMTFLRSEPKGW